MYIAGFSVNGGVHIFGCLMIRFTYFCKECKCAESVRVERYHATVICRAAQEFFSLIHSQDCDAMKVREINGYLVSGILVYNCSV